MQNPESHHRQRSGTEADDQLEIIREDSVVVQSVKAAGGGSSGGAEDPRQGSSIVGKGPSKLRLITRRFSSFTGRSSGKLDPAQSPAARALEGLKFITKTDDDAAAWAAAEKRFDKLTADTNGMLPRTLFAECIGMEKSKEFAGVLFEALARRTSIAVDSDSISKPQFKKFWDLIVDQGFDSRLQTFFQMVDRDGDGKITEDEVREIISLSASANKLTNIQNRADEYARLIMEELDPLGLGYIMIHRLEMILLHDHLQPEVAMTPRTWRNLSKMLSQKLKPPKDDVVKKCCRDAQNFLLDNWPRVWVVAAWIVAMAALYAYKYVQYKNKAVFLVMGHCVCLAKGAAETLKLNMALTLLPVCRNTITWLRNRTRLGAVVPFDDNINFHQMIGVAIIIGTAIHSIAHLACDFPRILHASPEKFKVLKPFFKHWPRNYWDFVTGWAGVTGIAMVIVMAISILLASPCLRRNKVKRLPKLLKKLTGFNTFWYSHHLFIIVYVLLVIHGFKLYFIHDWYKKTTLMYLAIPMILYAGERLIRVFRSNIEAVKIQEAYEYPGNVLTLHMTKPDGFSYKSGQYIFVKCPVVSPFEWHPFSITTAPGDDRISVHIRVLGDWTGQLKSVFSPLCQHPATRKSEPQEEKLHNLNYPKVLIDGPFGAPTQDYRNYNTVLLVGLGIGTTPMISVVKDIMNNMKEIDKEEGEEQSVLEEGGTSGSRSNNKHSPFKTRKAYFYWMTGEQGSFDWFTDVMNEVSEMDHKGVIEMHNYCTSVYKEGSAQCALIAMLQSINYAKNGMDIVSGTRVKSHFGRPKWKDVFTMISINHPHSTVGVFYCGGRKAMKELRKLAHDFSHVTSTKFEFHKENF